jgi:hypothetical protein
MATSAYFKSSKMLQRLHEGPLGGYIDLYSSRLLKEGHCRQSAWRCLRVVGDFSRWLAGKQIDLRNVDEGMVGSNTRPSEFIIAVHSRVTGLH